MEKEKKAQIRSRIDNSSIPEEIKLMFLVASACQSIVEHCDNRIRNVFASHGIKTKENDLLSGLNEYCKAVKLASIRFYDRIDRQIAGATFDVGGVDAYDGFNDNVCEIIQVIMLYVDRTAKSADAAEKVFKLLADMPSHGIFKDEDINHFVPRK